MVVRTALMASMALCASVSVLASAAHGQALAPEDTLLARAFERLDTNGNHTLTVAEIRAAAAQGLASLDRDGDGYVSENEHTTKRLARLRTRFVEADVNRDGMLDRDEMMAQAVLNAERRMTKLDANKDGKLSMAEIEAAPQFRKNKVGTPTLATIEIRMLSAFDRADRNRDGVVTLDEAQAARHKAKKQ